MALIAISTAVGVKKSNDQVNAANEATKEGLETGVENQNKLNEKAFKKRNEGTVLGGTNTLVEASTGGTVLTQTANKRSILG